MSLFNMTLVMLEEVVLMVVFGEVFVMEEVLRLDVLTALVIVGRVLVVSGSGGLSVWLTQLFILPLRLDDD